MPGNDAGGENFFAGFMEDYFAECDDHLTTVRRLLLAIEPDAGVRSVSPARLEELFRAFHSLKGLSGMVELREAELLAHHLESYLRELRGEGVVLSAAGLNALIQGTELLERVIAARRLDQPPPPIDDALVRLGALGTPAPGTPTAVPPVPGSSPEHWLIRFAPSPELAERGINVDRVRAQLRERGEIVSAAPRIGADGGISFEFELVGAIDPDEPRWRDEGVTIEHVAAEPAAESPDPGIAPEPVAGSLSLSASHFVRVDLARLDELMRMIGDLVITRARLADSLARVERHVPPVEWRAVQENSLAIERHVRDLREGVVRVRLVPVGDIFRRMPFVVRDLAREVDKRVKLELSGQDTEIDKFLIERMMDPILHLVRNAVSHGLETTAERRAAGKTDEGTLTLSAATVGEIVVLEISDDGRGIDAAAVLRRAEAAGLPIPDGPLTSDALLDILCAPGFSTRDAADFASGRGVGMAVVKTTVQELGGTLTLDTVPGLGTRFAIELPVTLAITDAIIGLVGAHTFAVPQSGVREVIEVDPAQVQVLENNEIVPYRGAVLPLVRLSALFGLDAQQRRHLHVLVTGHGQGAVGVVFDRIVGQREIVVRTITDPLIKVAGVSGATDLGDGRVVLILDLATITEHAGRGDTRVGGILARAAQAERRPS